MYTAVRQWQRVYQQKLQKISYQQQKNEYTIITSSQINVAKRYIRTMVQTTRGLLIESNVPK